MKPDRRAELAALAREIASQTAWDMALSGRPVPERVVERIELETFERLIEAETATYPPANNETSPGSSTS